ncbi:aldehyde dehydrogenase family protein, partial [Fructilactobacillus sanfranciscensis]
MVEKKQPNVEAIKKNIDDMVAKAHVALDEMSNFDQKKVDHITHAMVIAGVNAHQMLGEMAFKETGRGVAEDKAIKNLFATEEIWNNIRNDKTVGVIEENSEEDLIKVAEPLGVLAGITPVTNPTSTTLFKSIISMKTRNAIIFSLHPQAIKSSIKAAQIMRDAAIAAGAPKDAIQWITEPSREATNDLIQNPGVACTLATGGPGLVKAAYSTGKPALGVGPGNGPVYIEETANISRAVNDLVLSKTFDNGMICATENSAVIDASIYDDVKEQLSLNRVYFIPDNEKQKLTDAMFDSTRLSVKGPIAGAT